MEFLVLVGGVLSIPILYYSTQPVTSTEIIQKEKTKNEETPLSEQDLEKMKQRAQARKERILKNLNPNEQELFKEYINGILNPKPINPYERCMSLCIILLLVAALIIIVYLIVNSGKSLNKVDL